MIRRKQKDPPPVEVRYPGVQTAMDGSTAVVAMETAGSEAAGAYPITPSTQRGEGWAAARAAGKMNVNGRPHSFSYSTATCPARGVTLGSPVGLADRGYRRPRAPLRSVIYKGVDTMQRFVLSTLAGLMMTASAASAMQPQDLDINGDGFATIAEVRTVFPGFSSFDFRDVDLNDDNLTLYARLVAGSVRNEELRPFDAGAVARVVEHGSRELGDAEKISLYARNLTDFLREADYFARKNESAIVTTASPPARPILLNDSRSSMSLRLENRDMLCAASDSCPQSKL